MRPLPRTAILVDCLTIGEHRLARSLGDRCTYVACLNTTFHNDDKQAGYKYAGLRLM